MGGNRGGNGERKDPNIPSQLGEVKGKTWSISHGRMGEKERELDTLIIWLEKGRTLKFSKKSPCKRKKKIGRQGKKGGGGGICRNR